MAAASWTTRNVKFRGSNRLYKSKQGNKEDEINFDIDKDPRDNVEEILLALCGPHVSDGKKINYLNAFVKVVLKIEGNFEDYGFKICDILLALRITLLNESTKIRSGGLRAIRHVLRNDDDIKCLNKLLIPFLIARSLDLVLKNDTERIEAMKLIRKILLISPYNFNISLIRSLIALANSVEEEKDRMLRICLATLCELCVMNTKLFIESGGVAAITRNLLECQIPKISESLCGVLLFLLDNPCTRMQANIDLHSIAAPYCDFHYRHSWKKKDKFTNEKRGRFDSSRLALLSVLRSWPGILHFCSPNNKSGLKAIVQVLYLNQLEVRKAVLDLLYELLNLPQPEWTDELSVALNAVDPAELQSSWRLNEGFVAAEGRTILPHLAKTTPSINDLHLAFLLYSFLECGLLAAICEVISTGDTFISVRATVLLGELLHLIQLLLPPECCNISPALPTLLEYTVRDVPQALRAVSGLQQLHKLLRKRPASCSLFLDFILTSGDNIKFSNQICRYKHRQKGFKNKFQQLISKESDDVIKESGALSNNDASTWNWDLIRIILRGESTKIDTMETSHRTFLKQLVDFYKPGAGRYSHMDLSVTKVHLAYTITGIELINLLSDLMDEESDRFLHELFNDILYHIDKLSTEKSVHECLFSPQHMYNTQSQSYFLFIGRLATKENGVNLLKRLDCFKKLEKLATTAKNDCYVKLIVSSLDYSCPGQCRELLEAILKCVHESSRLYATQFLQVLLRAGTKNFAKWGVNLLVQQLYDSSKSVYLTALTILHEACEIQDCIETLIHLNPDLSRFGERGELLRCRFYSSSKGFDPQFVTDCISDIKRWDEYLNFRYVKIVEGEISDSLSLHQRDENGKYDKRTSLIRSTTTKEIFLPPHLYGQLSLHNDGFKMLIKQGSILQMLQILLSGVCKTDKDIVSLKAALWAIGHLGSSSQGVQLLSGNNGIESMINLAQNSLIYSIRATAYYALGLVACTRTGADELFKLRWFCTRHDRHAAWPIIEEEAWEEHLNNLHLDEQANDDFILDFGIIDIESSTDDDTTSGSNLVVSESRIPEAKRSSTLPNNQTTTSCYHKRSLSESKTFEIIRIYDQKMRDKRLTPDVPIPGIRYRNNSNTESTTSGVSSCESVCGGGVGGVGTSTGPKIYERHQVLSPIPSSCSLSTLKQPKNRRHSESIGRRISSGSNSERSQLASSAPNKLSHQDLMGYETLRNLRKNQINPWFLDRLDEYWSPSGTLIEDLNIAQGSLPSLSSVKRFSISDTNYEDRCYLGVGLPQNINSLFLDKPEHYEQQPINILEKYLAESAMIDSSIEHSSMDLNIDSTTSTAWKHDIMNCLYCSQSKVKPIDFDEPEKMRLEILRLVSKFSNPVWSKQVKQALIQRRQKNPSNFQDICVYSEVCKMMSESTFRINPRRMLQDIFYELNIEEMYKSVEEVFTLACSQSKDESASSIKSLDSLKLAYKENKFPIRKKNELKLS